MKQRRRSIEVTTFSYESREKSASDRNRLRARRTHFPLLLLLFLGIHALHHHGEDGPLRILTLITGHPASAAETPALPPAPSALLANWADELAEEVGQIIDGIVEDEPDGDGEEGDGDDGEGGDGEGGGGEGGDASASDHVQSAISITQEVTNEAQGRGYTPPVSTDDLDEHFTTSEIVDYLETLQEWLLLIALVE